MQAVYLCLFLKLTSMSKSVLVYILVLYLSFSWPCQPNITLTRIFNCNRRLLGEPIFFNPVAIEILLSTLQLEREKKPAHALSCPRKAFNFGQIKRCLLREC
jgi:hypothetical protein